MEKRKQIQDEALEAVRPHLRAGVGMSMGSGKTLVGLKHMLENLKPNSKFLVVAPKTAVFKTWKDEADKFGMSHLMKHVTFTTYRSLVKQSLDYSVVYLDECHSLLFSHDYFLARFIGKILGLTGTPPKNASSEKGKMVDKYCPIVFTYETDEAVEDKILNDYRILVHCIDLDVRRNLMVGNNKKFVSSEKASYEYWTRRIDEASRENDLRMSRIMRMKTMMTYPSKANYAKKLLEKINDKVILFANTTEQADSFNIPTYHSSNSKSEENFEKFQTGEVMQLATVLQLNEGINVRNLKQGIIMHAYGNERKASQRIGRLLRLNPDDQSKIHILCYRNTIDEVWVKEALQDFDQSKISWYHIPNF